MGSEVFSCDESEYKICFEKYDDGFFPLSYCCSCSYSSTISAAFACIVSSHSHVLSCSGYPFHFTRYCLYVFPSSHFLLLCFLIASTSYSASSPSSIITGGGREEEEGGIR